MYFISQKWMPIIYRFKEHTIRIQANMVLVTFSPDHVIKERNEVLFCCKRKYELSIVIYHLIFEKSYMLICFNFVGIHCLKTVD